MCRGAWERCFIAQKEAKQVFTTIFNSKDLLSFPAPSLEASAKKQIPDHLQSPYTGCLKH